MSTIHLFNCSHCGSTIKRSTSQVAHKRYKVKQGRSTEKWFCNHSCSASYGNSKRIKNIPPKPQPGNHYAQKYDKEFAFYMHRVRNDQRRDLKVLNESLSEFEDHIKEIWDGRCHYTNNPICLRPYISRGKAPDIDPFTAASLDRIDNEKPYCIGNVVWTSTFLNRARGNLPYNKFKSGLESFLNCPV